MRSKNLSYRNIAFFLVACFVLASCNRGGTGCPFDLDSGLSLIQLFLK